MGYIKQILWVSYTNALDLAACNLQRPFELWTNHSLFYRMIMNHCSKWPGGLFMVKKNGNWTLCALLTDHLSHKRTCASERRRLKCLADWSYLLGVPKWQNEGMAQAVQVGLWLLQVCYSLIKSHPCWVHPFLLRATVASSLSALLAQLAKGFGGSLYHLQPSLDAQLETG